jgi:plastocyanin
MAMHPRSTFRTGGRGRIAPALHNVLHNALLSPMVALSMSMSMIAVAHAGTVGAFQAGPQTDLQARPQAELQAGSKAGSTQAKPEAATDPTARSGARAHVVRIEAMRFSPEVLEVAAGDTVTWKNEDAFPHNATAERKIFASGNIESGRSWKFKATKKGTFPYVCTLHPGMKAVLIVK